MLCLQQFAKNNRRFSCSGALMFLAWMVTGSVGTVIASFYQPEWPRKTLFGQKVWFQVYSMHPQALATIILLFSFSFHDTLFSLTLFLASSRAYDANCHFDHCSLLPPIFLQERLEQSISHMTTHNVQHYVQLFYCRVIGYAENMTQSHKDPGHKYSSFHEEGGTVGNVIVCVSSLGWRLTMTESSANLK